MHRRPTDWARRAVDAVYVIVILAVVAWYVVGWWHLGIAW